jgi:hypothetical protein
MTKQCKACMIIIQLITQVINMSITTEAIIVLIVFFILMMILAQTLKE